MCVSLHLVADGRERARHQLHKEPPLLPNLLPGNTGMATGMQPRQVDLVHSFHYIKKKEKEEKKEASELIPILKTRIFFHQIIPDDRN